MALARRLFADLEAATADPPGVTRVAFGDGERKAFAIMAEAGRSLGAEVAHDFAGNQFLTLAGRDRSRVIQIGSHLDTVPHGGNFDGAAGVVMGLAAQAALVAEGCKPPFDVTVICLRAEESCWFPHSYVGSKAALGLLGPEILSGVRRSDTGRTLAEHIAEEGFDPEAVGRGARRIEPERIVAHVEPHIEQGPVLVADGRPVGLVTSIRGSFRYREMRCLGTYAHSGTTPRAIRSDAVVAAADLVLAMQSLWEAFEIDGHDLAVTFGQIGTDPSNHSFSKVAGEVHLCLDVRSESTQTLALVQERLKATIWEIEQRRRVRFELGALSGSEPARMSDELVALLADAARRAEVPVRMMASGAGHDAATYALAGVPSAMLFIRNANGSHNPDEQMEMADFEAAFAVLLAFLQAPPAAFRPLLERSR